MSSDRDAKSTGKGASPPAPADAPGPRAAADNEPIGVANSGSIEVMFTGPQAALTSDERSDRGIDAAPAAVRDDDSAPVASGRLPAVAVSAAAHDASMSRRLSDAAKEAIGDGVTKLGSGIGTLGEGISKLGERAHKVPLVGAGVAAVGESLTTVGESLTELPRVAHTRRGRLLVRSMLVAFLLVFAWIAIIIALQVRGVDAPDFRPTAESILTKLSAGEAGIEQVYEDSSPRFHEMVRKDRFMDEMTDMNATIGNFLEIAAINDSLVTTGPTGRVGRVSLTVAYEKGKARASVSLHWDKGRWKLLGINVDVPPELQITKAQREDRVKACSDPMSPKKCDVFVAANAILEQLRDGRAGEVWDNATKIFQKQEEKSRFVTIQAEHAATLGEYRRIIAVTEAKLYNSGTIASFDALTEYAKSQGVRATFGFYRRSRMEPWKLRSLKVVLPMPRAEESLEDPAAAGSGSAKPSERPR